LFLQNHADGIVFQSVEPVSAGELRIEHDDAEAAESHFFIAVCGIGSTPRASTFVYVPKSANVLRERELHIHRLEGELLLKDDWLEKAKEEHRQLVEISRSQKVELEESNRWAEDLNRKLKETGARVLALQEELTALAAGYESKIRGLEKEVVDSAAGYESKIRELEREKAEIVAAAEARFQQSETEKGELAAAYEAKLRESEQERARVAAAYESKIRELEEEGARTSEWALHTDALLHETEQVLIRKQEELAEKETGLQAKCAELESKCQELAACVDFLHAAEATLEERTTWALGLQSELGNAQSELEQAKARLNYVRASRWVRMGRAVGIGPELGNS
jgi:chromosome segregation ATPase